MAWKTNPDPLSKTTSDEFAVRAFRKSERRLQKLLGGKLDSIVLQDGHHHFLRDAQEMLRQSEERFRNMFAASVIGMAISTPLGRFLEANAAYCQIFGYSSDEMLTKSFAELTHPEDLALNLKLRDEILAGQRDSFVMEKRYLKKDGASVWANVSMSATRTITGEIGAFVVIAEDITLRKAAEHRLSRLNRLHAVLSEIGGAMMRQQGRQKLYESICRIVVERGLLRMAFIAEFEPGKNIAFNVASFGESLESHIAAPDAIPIRESPWGEEVVDKAIRTGVYAVCNDMNPFKRTKSSRRANLKLGFHASAAFPFQIGHQKIGVLVLFASEMDYFQADEIALMVTVAENLTFAIEIIENERQRQIAEARSNHLAAIVESSVDAIVSEDLSGIITSWNRGAAVLFGYEANEMVGTSIRRLIPFDKQGEENRIIDLATRGESLQNFETLRQAKDGRLINVSITASPIKNAAGEIIGLSKLVHDTTQTKKAEARFRRLVDSNAQGVCFWNATGGIYDANDAFLALLGYSRDELESRRMNWLALTPPEYAELDQNNLDECVQRGYCKPYEKEYIRKDGKRVPILIGSAAFDDNRAEGVSFVVDLSERKTLEQQFRQAQKMEAIGNLAGGVAHDFNNILAVIQIQADFLNGTSDLSPEQADSMEDIIAAVERAAGLTRQLLLFSSRESFQPQEIDLSESITNTVKLFKRLVGEHIEMQFRMASQPMFLLADPGMMDQVLLNLVVNARDAMPNGGHLVIETSGVEFDEFAASHSAQVRVGSFVCLSVSDTGCGIPPENFARIFEPFFTTKDVGKGTGLGLATVFGIVQQHQGWVNVYSEVNHGTTFRIYLPRLARNGKSLPSALTPHATYLGTETILLVEDDPKLRNSVIRALSHLGYRVLEAQDGNAALAVWKEHSDDISILLTDLVMPGDMTGKQLARTLLRENPHLDVIYMSGYSVEVVGKDFELKEDVNFLTKPFPSIKLAKIVRKCLDRRRGENSVF
jgi:PAS domain S-box-containing protein